MRLGLRHKLIRGFALILFVVVALALVNLHTSKTIQARLQETIQLDAAAAHTLTAVSRQVGLVHTNALFHLHATSRDDMEIYASRVSDAGDEVNVLLDALENTLRSREVLHKLAEFRFAWSAYSSLRDELMLPASAENRKQEALSFAHEGGTVGIAAQAAFDAFEELREASAMATNHHLELAAQQQRTSQAVLVALTVLAIVPALAFSMHLSSQIADAIDVMSDVAQLVAGGDADWNVTLDTGDELERLADCLNAITRNMRKLRAAKREATDNLHQQVHEQMHVQEILSIERERLALTLDSVGDGVITTDQEGRVDLINSTAAKLVGWDRAGAAGKPLDEILHILDEITRSRCENPLERALSGATTDGSDHHATLVTECGTEHRIALSAVPIRDKDGCSDGAFLILRDANEQDDPGVPSS